MFFRGLFRHGEVAWFAAVVERLFAGDDALFQKAHDRFVEGVAAVAAADLHETDELFELALADAVADAVVRTHHLAGEHAAMAIGAGHQSLADDGFEHAGQLRDDLRLLVRGENIDQAVDRLRCVGRMEGGKNKVARLGSRESDANGIEVAQFGDDDDIRILAQCLAQSGGKTTGGQASGINSHDSGDRRLPAMMHRAQWLGLLEHRTHDQVISIQWRLWQRDRVGLFHH